MKIGVLGSGDVGQVLSDGFLKHGYEVMRGSRTPAKLEDWMKKTGGKAKIGTFSEAAAFADTIVLAVKGDAAVTVMDSCSKDAVGKTILDATNPIAASAPVNGVLSYFTDPNSSLMETLQSRFPKSHFVKCFSSVGNSNMINPNFGSLKPTMFICGNNSESKTQATKILDQFGWEAEDMGSVEAARAIEPLCMLWCIPGFQKNQWTHAFKLLKR